MATSMKLALVTLGISQQSIIRAAAKQGQTLWASALSDIVNGRRYGSVKERAIIARAFADVAKLPLEAAEQLLPNHG